MSWQRDGALQEFTSFVQTVCFSFFLGGADCEIDFNGCSYEPCSWRRNCIDLNATSHMLNGKAYECTPCPDGYDQIDERCQGKMTFVSFANLLTVQKLIQKSPYVGNNGRDVFDH